MTRSGSRRALLKLGLGALAGVIRLPRGMATPMAMAVPASSSPSRRLLYVQPLGSELPRDDVVFVKTSLEGLIGLEARVLATMALPAAAYYRPRARYRADKLLDVLDGRLPADGARVLGLTGVDISTTKGDVFDWGVLGLGRLDGASSVISEFRCRMKSRGVQQTRERLGKVAVHEMGHTLGLEHCPTRGCLMEDAAGRVATCDREYDFCALCRARLAAAGHALPAAPAIPWRRP